MTPLPDFQASFELRELLSLNPILKDVPVGRPIVSYDEGLIYVAGENASAQRKVWVVDSELGRIVNEVQLPQTPLVEFIGPTIVSMDAKSGRAYVLDTFGNIYVLNKHGLLSCIELSGFKARLPGSIAVNWQGIVYVSADFHGLGVLRLEPDFQSPQFFYQLPQLSPPLQGWSDTGILCCDHENFLWYTHWATPARVLKFNEQGEVVAKLMFGDRPQVCVVPPKEKGVIEQAVFRPFAVDVTHSPSCNCLIVVDGKNIVTFIDSNAELRGQTPLPLPPPLTVESITAAPDNELIVCSFFKSHLVLARFTVRLGGT